MRTTITGVNFYRAQQFVSHHWLTIAFVAGFVTDFILLDAVDDAFDNAVLLFYVLLATASLVLFYVSVAERGPSWFVRLLTKLTPITMQYAFGGLLSGMLIFYGRSGDLLASAPFLLLIVGVIIANELVTKRSERLLYNVSLYFIGVFSYCVLIVPVWLGKVGDVVFVGSGLIAVALTMFLIKMLKHIVPNFLTMQKRLLVFSVGCLYALLNGFYFFNIIPPIPLSLHELGIYQSVEKEVATGSYRVMTKQRAWYETLPWYPVTIQPLPGKGVACFARVYAPTDLSTTIVHRWSKQLPDGSWQERAAIPYSISGGNDEGYRGYTRIESIEAGRWRCSVENERGQVLGRRTFTVDMSTTPQNLVTVIK